MFCYRNKLRCLDTAALVVDKRQSRDGEMKNYCWHRALEPVFVIYTHIHAVCFLFPCSFGNICADLLSSRSESPSVVDGPVSQLHTSKAERLASSPQSFETQNPSQSGQPSFRSVSGLLELGIICLPGTY